MFERHERCAVKRCKNKGELTWYDNPVCWSCWMRHSSEDNSFNLHKEFTLWEKHREKEHYPNA